MKTGTMPNGSTTMNTARKIVMTWLVSDTAAVLYHGIRSR
jgi:hypothetical protein